MTESTESSYERVAVEALAVIDGGHRWMLELAEQFQAIDTVLSDARKQEERRRVAASEAVPAHLSVLLRYGSVNPERLASAGRTLARFHAAAFKKEAERLVCKLPEKD